MDDDLSDDKSTIHTVFDAPDIIQNTPKKVEKEVNIIDSPDAEEVKEIVKSEPTKVITMYFLKQYYKMICVDAAKSICGRCYVSLWLSYYIGDIFIAFLLSRLFTYAFHFRHQFSQPLWHLQ